MDGEQLVVEIEAEMYDVGSGPLGRILGIFSKFTAKFTGSVEKGFLVVTDKRIITVTEQKVCCVFQRSKGISCYLPNSVYKMGWRKEGTLLCLCPTINLWYSTKHGDGKNIRMIGATEDTAMKIVDAFFKMISQSNALIRQ